MSKKDGISYLNNALSAYNKRNGLHDPDWGMGKSGFVEEIQNGINELVNTQDQNLNVNIVKINARSGLSDVVRIFESMKESGIISAKTEVSQIVSIFFSESVDNKRAIDTYNRNNSEIRNDESNSNSKQLVEFTKILITKSFGRKKKVLEEIADHIVKEQKKP